MLYNRVLKISQRLLCSACSALQSSIVLCLLYRVLLYTLLYSALQSSALRSTLLCPMLYSVMLYRALLYAPFCYTLQSSTLLYLLYRVCSTLLVLQSLLYSACSTKSALLCLHYRVCSGLPVLQSLLWSALHFAVVITPTAIRASSFK